MTDDLTARLRVTYAAHVPDPDQDDDAPFDILASEMVDLTALLLEAAEALTAERQAREQAEQRAKDAEHGWLYVIEQIEERAEQAEQERDLLREALRSVVVDCEDGTCTLCERCVMSSQASR